MGSLTLPNRGIIYVDANCVIYSLETVEPYSSILRALWEAAATGRNDVVTSELSLLEALVKPFRDGNTELERRAREFLLFSRGRQR